MSQVRCPKCLVDQPVASPDAEGKFFCRMCGQKLKVPPSPANKTVLAQWSEEEPKKTDPFPRRLPDEPPAAAIRSYTREEETPRRRDVDPDPAPSPRRTRRDDYEEEDERPRRRRRGNCEDRGTIYCPHCDRDVRPRISTRMAKPWGLVCILVGVFLVFFLLGIALIVLGILLKQRVEKCPDCGDVLEIGEVGFGS